ncbi:SCO family protein [Candidatus Poriferisodalis sp.]|uniref:SCO family protein n=1 Tax=Candidatus Poriferisodalis sp. TaxID=3101277 RepID=UPI003B0136E6
MIGARGDLRRCGFPGATNRRIAVLFAALALVLVACGGGGGDDTGSDDIGAPHDWSPDSQYEGLAVPLEDLRQVPEMMLTDTSGNDFHLAADTQGHVRLIYQMFTNCPDICGVQLAQLASVLNRPGAPTNVTVLAVTVDPERDSPDVLRAYLDQFSDDFVGLIPDSEQQLTDLQNTLGALASIRISDTATTTTHQMPSGDGDTGDAGDTDMAAMDHGEVDYDIAHDARVFAYAPNGYGYAQYPHPTRQTQFDNDLPILARIEPNSPAGAGV